MASLPTVFLSLCLLFCKYLFAVKTIITYNFAHEHVDIVYVTNCFNKTSTCHPYPLGVVVIYTFPVVNFNCISRTVLARDQKLHQRNYLGATV